MGNETYVYRLMNSSESEDFFGFFSYINVISDGIFFPIILLVIFSAMFISMLLGRIRASAALLFTSFICTIIGMIFAVLDLLAPKYLYLCVLGIAIGVVWSKLEGGNGL